jgi:2-(1,2-epoxy-1,2-dihydrophenyl)acetyl-CoA isomerase
MTYETILHSSANGIARVTLNRPDRLNSFTVQMHGELRDALAKVRADASTRVLLLTGAGRGFCAGQDLSDREVPAGGAPLDLGASIESNYRPLVLNLRSFPVPVVCAVNGVAAGAGANAALACDLVIAAKSASFIQAFCKIGLLPDAGGTFFLPRLVGTARAMGLALLGDRLSAREAAEWGLIWKCVEDADLTSTVDALLAQLATAPTKALLAARRAIHASANAGLEAQLDLERDLQRELGYSADFREGVDAFLAKRAPKFSGI